MLRRKPTAIAITSEDIAAFEEARLRKLSEENKHPEQHAKATSNVNIDPSDELKPLPGDKARITTIACWKDLFHTMTFGYECRIFGVEDMTVSYITHPPSCLYESV
ncbi:hypothetical protein DTO013E5_8993 [Penicillium roqueforti]|uniref:uncharacterized protein n=1 Tax=Penicillium roqueforti TaxID=5082 RepID=UPI00190DE6BF|nr:uncharacterized protein LCP9604111_9128 [Penicillium roqueforti]KAF9239363.1 hypothetical protein LCP9604111_9128 [Penicillium roqueforti]KAI1835816.1 hypothetical protein CBS147337_2965 [Penicillium roqueforti]KAI2670719.1 hypothetical protein CBS147355_9054 [Penicillium roqueforti]KAI2684121.1 hypothetical protein LCP963914a_5421 [Penicillium roqueforti]KAI2697723.1 hypothetical protein CBS147332_8706 [Penicillium roqueforti]